MIDALSLLLLVVGCFLLHMWVQGTLVTNGDSPSFGPRIILIGETNIRNFKPPARAAEYFITGAHVRICTSNFDMLK